MDISRFPAPPSPWPARVARDLEVLLLSILLGFCIWFVGGSLLTGQVLPPPVEAPIYSEDEEMPDADTLCLARDEIGIGVTPTSCQWQLDDALTAVGRH